MKFVYAIIPFVILLVLTGIFFGGMITGSEIIVTPDFGLSDILHVEYPTKLSLSQSLKARHLPLWNRDIATGFPQLGFPTGLYHPLNLILLTLPPMPLGFNLIIVSTFLTISFSTYLLLGTLGQSRIVALWCAIVFGFSAPVVVKIVHIFILQTFSLFPLLLLFCERTVTRQKITDAFFFALVLGIQLLTGYFQIVALSLIVVGIYAVARLMLIRSTAPIRPLTYLLVGVIAGFVIGAAQLLPSLEFVQQSNRAAGVTQAQINLFPYPPKHLITFIWPYLLGDPRDGTYPMYSKNWGIFWENTGYIGIIPLFAALYALKRLKKQPIIVVFLIIGCASFILMLGSHSPLGFLYRLPPLSLFRVPARAILFLSFSLTIVGGYGVTEFLQRITHDDALKQWKQAITVAIFALTIIPLFLFGLFYHARAPASQWLAQTQTTGFFKKDTAHFRVMSVGNESIWNNLYLEKGWLGHVDSFRTFLESQQANWNLTQGISNVSVYEVLVTRRFEKIWQLLDLGIIKRDEHYLVSPATAKTLNFENVKYLISPLPIEGNQFQKVFTTTTTPSFSIYENTTVMPQAYLIFEYELAKDQTEAQQKIIADSFDPQKTVILEKKPPGDVQPGTGSAKIVNETDRNLEIETQADSAALLITSHSVYPGWRAYVDGKETEIVAANINSRAVSVPAGTHRVRFTFVPQSFYVGITTSIAGLLSILGLLSIFFLKKIRTKQS